MLDIMGVASTTYNLNTMGFVGPHVDISGGRDLTAPATRPRACLCSAGARAALGGQSADRQNSYYRDISTNINRLWLRAAGVGRRPHSPVHETSRYGAAEGAGLHCAITPLSGRR